jgi:hypothetical protein
MAVYRGPVSSHGIRDTSPAKVATPEFGLQASISHWARVSVQNGKRGLNAEKSTAVIKKNYKLGQDTTTPHSGSSGRYDLNYERQYID